MTALIALAALLAVFITGAVLAALRAAGLADRRAEEMRRRRNHA